MTKVGEEFKQEDRSLPPGSAGSTLVGCEAGDVGDRGRASCKMGPLLCSDQYHPIGVGARPKLLE